MWKKIALYTTFAAVAGLLVLGAVNRTMARTEQVSGENGAPRGVNSSIVEQGNGHGNGAADQSAEGGWQGRGGSGGGNGGKNDGAAAGEAASASGRQNLLAGQGGGRRGQNAEASAEAPVDAYEWQQVTGEVVQVDSTQMTLRLDDGTDLLVEGRPWQYAQQAGFQAQVGNRLQVRGYTEDGEFKVGAVLNLDGDQEQLQLRDAAGQPAWRGQGDGRGGS